MRALIIALLASCSVEVAPLAPPRVEGVGIVSGPDRGEALLAAQGAAAAHADRQCRMLRCGDRTCTRVRLLHFTGLCTPIEAGMSTCTIKVSGLCEAP
jgi:hypothetical protein